MKKWVYIALSLTLFIAWSPTVLATVNLGELMQEVAEYYGLEIRGEAYSDYNGDGQEDMAVILSPPYGYDMEEEETAGELAKKPAHAKVIFPRKDFKVVAPCIWVASLDNGKLKVWYEILDSVLGSDDGGFRGLEDSINGYGSVISYSANGGSNWRWGFGIDWRYQEGVFVPIEYSDNWSFLWTLGDSSWIDLETYKGRYEYSRGPAHSEEVITDVGGEVSYYWFLPGKAQAVTVDGLMEPVWFGVPKVENRDEMITYGKNRWTGPKDLSFSTQTILIGSNLYIYVVVNDDQVIFDQTGHLKQDHIEIWLDGWFSMEALITDEQRELYNDTTLYRRTKEGLYQFAIYKSEAVSYLPKTQPEKGIQHKLLPSSNGYVAEIMIPLASYLESDIKNFERIGFTIVVSDTDSTAKPAQDTLMATSELVWGDPFTLGAIFMTLPNDAPLYSVY